MHIGEALMPRDTAVQLASDELTRVVARNARYYGKLPNMQPDPQRPLMDGIRADDTWYFIPFARRGAGTEPLFVRVNGVTKVVIIERSF